MNSSNHSFEVWHLQEENATFHTIRVVAHGGVGVLTVLVNAAIGTAFLVQKVRRPAVQLSPTGVLVLNLVAADALLGIIFCLSSLIPVLYCGIRAGVTYLGSIGSQTALINVVVDRFIAIVYPLRHRDWVTMNRSLVMVTIGWLIPVVLGVTATSITSNDSLTAGVARCSDIPTFTAIFRYLWLPSHIFGNFCVLMVQCCVYFSLRSHDAANNVFRRSSDKSAKIFYGVITPTYMVMFAYDVVVLVIVAVVGMNPVIKSVHDVILLFVQLTFLANPVVYSYATANIRRPISDLLSDLKRWVMKPAEPKGTFVAPRARATPGAEGSSSTISTILV